MTTVNEAKAPETKQAKPAHLGKAASYGTSLVANLAIFAFLAWLGGVALNRGFGVHVPFMAAWILLFTILTVVKLTVTEVGQSWHAARVQADIRLMGAALAVQELASQRQSKDGLGGLAEFLGKLGNDDADTGAYL